jgi:hypothetical protein
MFSRSRNLLIYAIFMVASAVCIVPAAADAADRTIVFQPVTGNDITLVQQVLGSDLRLNDLVQRDYIRITKDVHIAKADLDDSGTDEVLLMVKHNGDPPCTQQPCELEIWKQEVTMLGNWKQIGSYMMTEEKLKLYDEKYNGFHEIANSEGIIPWNDN